MIRSWRAAARDALRSRDALAVLALALLVGVSYLPAVRGDFVWDDQVFSDEPVIHAVSGLRNIWFSPTDIRNEGHYWPLVYTSFWLEHKLWGLRPAGYHLVNIVLHLINSVLIGRLLLRLRVPGAWAVAAVFAVHPLHVESVAWIIERKDVLSALFYLTAVLTWTRFVQAPRAGRYALALALYTAGLLSKSVVVTLPVALLIWHWWQHGRVTRTDLLRLAPFALVGLAITLADLSMYGAREPLALGYTPVERLLIAARAVWFYAGKLVWPAGLAGIYPLWRIDAGEPLAWAYVAAALGLGAALFLARGRIGRGPLAGALFFVVTLSPTLGFVDYGYMQFALVADRFQYLAGIGVLAVLVGAAAYGARKLPERLRVGAWGLAAVVVVLLGALTWRQAGIYRDDVALFSHVVAHNPQARDAHLNLGRALMEADRMEEGLAASLIALEQSPEDADALANIGRALVKLERFDEAEDYLRRARASDSGNRTALQNTAALLLQQGRYEEAAAAFAAVIDQVGDFALAYAGMGDALYRLERHAEALQALQRAMAMRPDLPAARSLYVTMGHAARALGRLDDAAAWYERSAAIDPGNPDPLVALAALRSDQGRADEAAAYLRRARALRPADPGTLHRIAEQLRLQSRFPEAIAGYREALDLDPDYAPAHAGMGIALFQSGRYEPAIEAMTRALALDPEIPVAAPLHLFIGHSHAALGRPAAAVEQYERAVRSDPANAEALDHLAMSRFGEERYQEALELYRTLAELNPDNALTHSNIGVALLRLGRLEEALASIERALALDPDLAVAQAGLRQVRRALGQEG